MSILNTTYYFHFLQEPIQSLATVTLLNSFFTKHSFFFTILLKTFSTFLSHIHSKMTQTLSTISITLIMVENAMIWVLLLLLLLLLSLIIVFEKGIRGIDDEDNKGPLWLSIEAPYW